MKMKDGNFRFEICNLEKQAQLCFENSDSLRLCNEDLSPISRK